MSVGYRIALARQSPPSYKDLHLEQKDRRKGHLDKLIVSSN